jgi:hypothetical protein
MTVEELIEELRELPGHLTVYVEVSADDYWPALTVIEETIEGD